MSSLVRWLFPRHALTVFLVLAAVLWLAPLVFSSFRVGSGAVGVPFTYYRFSSAPPPAYGSTFSWPWLLANLASYAIVAWLVALGLGGKAHR
jgi:hypothetical protein